MKDSYDAVVVGAGPNGLAAAIVLARAGRSVLVREAASVAGGGMRSEELTLPGFLHDVCSAVHPLAVSSPLFASIPLGEHGLEWIEPVSPVAHPLDDQPAVVMDRCVDATAGRLGADENAYRALFGWMRSRWSELSEDLLAPLRPPRSPLLLARFGAQAFAAAADLARSRFRTVAARALFAGHAAHAQLPLESLATAAFGLVLCASAHAVGWPLPRGGSKALAVALVSYARSLGCEVAENAPVSHVRELPETRVVLFDLTPRQVLALAGERFPAWYRRKLSHYRYGLGVFKVDWALNGPIPWRDEACARAATVHVGGTFEQIARSEAAPWRGACAERPFVLLVQPTLFDGSRAPAGFQIGWAYCHVPNGSRVDMTRVIESQIERFAPGFVGRIVARHVMYPADFERHNPNNVGGDINGGVQSITQLFTRPTLRTYRTPAKGFYLCSSSTPPGGGVHGMCGYHAACAALEDHA